MIKCQAAPAFRDIHMQVIIRDFSNKKQHLFSNKS